MRRIRQSRSDEGQALIETAMTITVLMFTIFLIVEMVLMIYTYNVMADAAKEGVRYAVVHGSNNSSPAGPSAPPSATSQCFTNSGPVYTRVQQFTSTSLHDTSVMTVTVCYLDGSNNPPSRVQVNVSYPLVPYFAFTVLPTVKAQAHGNVAF